MARLAATIGAIDIVSDRDHIIRDITVNTVSSEHEEKIVDAVKRIDGIEVVNVSDRTFLLHIGGRIEVVAHAVEEAAYATHVARRDRAAQDGM